MSSADWILEAVHGVIVVVMLALAAAVYRLGREVAYMRGRLDKLLGDDG